MAHLEERRAGSNPPHFQDIQTAQDQHSDTPQPQLSIRFNQYSLDIHPEDDSQVSLKVLVKQILTLQDLKTYKCIEKMLSPESVSPERESCSLRFVICVNSAAECICVNTSLSRCTEQVIQGKEPLRDYKITKTDLETENELTIVEDLP
jgi:hypothetical protein